jgi:hypothetical protein
MQANDYHFVLSVRFNNNKVKEDKTHTHIEGIHISYVCYDIYRSSSKYYVGLDIIYVNVAGLKVHKCIPVDSFNFGEQVELISGKVYIQTKGKMCPIPVVNESDNPFINSAIADTPDYVEPIIVPYNESEKDNIIDKYEELDTNSEDDDDNETLSE